MNFVKRFIKLLKKIFKKENVEMICAPKETPKEDFISSLKVSLIKKKKRKVETLVCPGDGLGIQNKIQR